MWSCRDQTLQRPNRSVSLVMLSRWVPPTIMVKAAPRFATILWLPGVSNETQGCSRTRIPLVWELNTNVSNCSYDVQSDAIRSTYIGDTNQVS